MNAPLAVPTIARHSAASSAGARSLGCLSAGMAMLALWPARREETTLRADLPCLNEARSLHGAAALLAGAVLIDSALEHYRGDFANPGMATPLLVSLAALLAGGRGAASAIRPGATTYWVALATGAAGTAFHWYNLRCRPGGVSWANLFYHAPLGAPAALSLAGALGLSARKLSERAAAVAPRLAGLPAGRALAALVAAGMAGTAAEAGLYHFRGAYQNPFMWLPVSVPPLAAALLGAAALGCEPAKARRMSRFCLGITALLGLGGIGFHAYGVARQMGGWRNWSQSLLSGPPLSAPPSFTALALAGLTALRLLRRSPP